MPTRPKFFLLDAGPVIELHRLGIWEKVMDCCDLLVPRYIALKETVYWRKDDESIHSIRLQEDIKAGRIEAPETDSDQLLEVLNRFDSVMKDGVDAGELHALTILHNWPKTTAPPEFCTGDRLATIALCLLGFSNLAISLEELLNRLGLSRKPGRAFRREKMISWVADGVQRRLRGEGLREDRSQE